MPSSLSEAELVYGPAHGTLDANELLRVDVQGAVLQLPLLVLVPVFVFVNLLMLFLASAVLLSVSGLQLSLALSVFLSLHAELSILWEGAFIEGANLLRL